MYFTKRPHEHTMGYIAKCGMCVCRHGTTQTTIDEWLVKSREYCKQKETDRKRRSRTREDELAQIIAEITDELEMKSKGEKFFIRVQAS